MNLFENVFRPTTAPLITAHFTNGQTADYTTEILALLKSDPEVWAITSVETGEVIYSR